MSGCRMELCPNWNGHGCIRGYIDSCDHAAADETARDHDAERDTDLRWDGEL